MPYFMFTKTMWVHKHQKAKQSMKETATRLEELLNPIWSQKLSLPWNETNNFDFPKGISSGMCMAHSNYPRSPKCPDRRPAAYLSSSWPSSQVLWHFPLLPTWMWLKTKANCIKVSGRWVALHGLRTTAWNSVTTVTVYNMLQIPC